ncbi:MAG: M20 family metallopeptidase [Proteobacteria bacterium]|nr:M20 family metallopeptidase [Pseudomonadota bacterium]
MMSFSPNHPSEYIRRWQDDYTRFRRDLHAHPELGLEEHRTAQRISERLTALGIEHHTGIGKTGIVAAIRGREASPHSIGLRADMDALPIQEEGDCPHVSTVPGCMHACGHDGHTTMLLACAHYLQETRRFAGTAYLIFQPAEEGRGGGKAMLADGLFERFPAERIFALHNWPGLPVGKVAVRSGPVMAACDYITIDIEGCGGHGAHPHLTVDPVLVTGHIITAVQSVVSRNISPLDHAVVSLCGVRAGNMDAKNVIPRTARLVGTVRTFDTETQEWIEVRLRELVTTVAAGFGAVATLRYDRIDPATINNVQQAQFAARVAAQLFGEENVVHDLEPSMGAEDFSYMLQKKPGAYLRLGQGSGDGKHDLFLHNSRYDFNDAAIPYGAGLLAGLVEAGLPLSGDRGQGSEVRGQESGIKASV